MILLPSFTITIAEKGENPGNRGFAFKVHQPKEKESRKYLFAAEDDKEMKTWMNVISLATIAFGSGKASMTRVSAAAPVLSAGVAQDKDWALMQARAGERAGGVVGVDEAPIQKKVFVKGVSTNTPQI